MDALIIRESIEGIQREINRRSANLQTIKDCVTGNEKRFTKPVKDQTYVINEGLRLFREIEKLKKIRDYMKILLLK